MDLSRIPARPVIDVHTHILPREWPDLAERYGYGGFVRLVHEQPGCARMMIDGRDFRTVDENCWSPERRIAECDAVGVDVQVLSTVPVMFSYWARPEHGLDLSRLLNDHIAGVVRDHPGRFVGLGTVPLQDVDRAVGELERCVRELRFPGVQIGTNVNGLNLGERELLPFFQAADRIGACVFVHPWEMLGRERMTKYWLPWLVGMPAETSLAICSMLFGGVFEACPNLRVCFAHGGGAFPATMGRIQHGFEVRPDLCAVDNQRPPQEYLPRLYFDSLVHEPLALKLLVDLVGAGRIALGSDYPFPLGELRPGELIRTVDWLDDGQRAQLLGGTALEWLGLRSAGVESVCPESPAGPARH